MSCPVIEACDRLEKRLDLNRTQEEVFESCVQIKLSKMFEKEDKEFDNLITKLEKSVDYNSLSDVKKCVVRIHTMLARYRKVMSLSIRRFL